MKKIIQKKKILFIINNLEMGGAESFLVLLLNYLQEYKDLELVLFTLTGGGYLEKKLKKENIKIKIFKYRVFIPFLHRFDPFIRFRLVFYVWKEKPDLIHGHLLGSDLATKILGGIFKIPTVITQHDMIIQFPGKKHFMANNFLTNAIAVSGVVGEYLDKVFKINKEKIIEIPDGIEIKEFASSVKVFNSKKPIFIFIGRLIPSKGVQYAIKGLAKLKKEYPDLKLLIYGDGFYRKKLEDLANDNKHNFVEFRGKTKDIKEALREGDILILPSETEGFSMAVLEACASKKPIIATKTGAIPDMVEDGVSGFLIKKHSHKDIYEKAKKILNENLVTKFGQESYKKVKDTYDISKVAKKHHDLYLGIIEKYGEKKG